MTKSYKIEKLGHTFRNPVYVEKDGVFNADWKETTLTFPFSAIIDKLNEIIDVVNSEALSDKEEVKLIKDVEASLCPHGFSGNGVMCKDCKEESKLGSFAGTFCGKNIYFECEDKKIWDNFQKALQSKSFLFEQPKQEKVSSVTFSIPPGNKRMLTVDGGKTFVEYKTKQEKCECKYISNQVCDICQSETKQSTSLKEDQFSSIRTLKEDIYDSLLRMVKSDRYRNTASTLEMTEEILKLIQSHIVKEIEKQPTIFLQGTWLSSKEDIIKIINNLTK